MGQKQDRSWPLLKPRSLESVPHPPRCSKSGTAKTVTVPAVPCAPALIRGSVVASNHFVYYLCPVAYLRVGLVGPRPHQVRRCPTICGHILGYYTVNHQVPCHIIDCLTYTITTGSLVVVIAWASSLAYWSLADRHRDWSCSALVQTQILTGNGRGFNIFASAPILCPTTKQILATPLFMPYFYGRIYKYYLTIKDSRSKTLCLHADNNYEY